MEVMLDDLIASLKKVRKKTGNIPVGASGFLGTNNGFVSLQFESLPKAKDSLTAKGSLSLFLSLCPKGRKRILKEIKKMEELGYAFYPSQFRKEGEPIKAGVSLCDWHNPW